MDRLASRAARYLSFVRFETSGRMVGLSVIARGTGYGHLLFDYRAST